MNYQVLRTWYSNYHSDDIKINGTQIGHTSDEDAISIASNGVVTFTQIPVLLNDSITQAFIADDAVGADQHFKCSCYCFYC